jgi:ATP-dependent protease HslVU (ClpYQ) peptidase subunit
MTTIAYRDGVLAADSLVTLGDTKVHGYYHKIVRIDDHLIGTAGSVAACQHFLDWLREGGDESAPPKGDYKALVVNPKGKVREFENGSLLPVPRGAKFFSIGSGSPYALAAMYAGASSTDAVKIAAKIDTSTGLPVRVLKVQRG